MSLPSHVLMTADAVGGVWTYALDLALALVSYGVRVSLATMGPRPLADQREEALRVPGLTLHESDFRLEWMDNAWDDVDAASDWLLGLEKQLAPDLIHLNGYVHGALAWRAPVAIVAHSCVVSWWNAVRGGEPPPSWETYRRRVRAGLLGADVVLAVSKFMTDAVARHYGVPGAVAIPNTRDPLAYAPSAKGPFILTSGRAWDEAKNITTVDAAARGVKWPVYLAGQTQHPSGGAAEIRRLRKLGRLSAGDLRRWLARASIYALPAVYEPFGLSVLEAALSGCALVLSDIPSLRENWEGAACFVNPRDAAELGAALAQLADDDEGRHRLARRARLRALEFSPERMAESYLAVYRQVSRKEASSCG